LGNKTDKSIETPSAKTIMPSEVNEEICNPISPENIFKPIKNKIKAKPFCK
jgi:hypothetical protein